MTAKKKNTPGKGGDNGKSTPEKKSAAAEPTLIERQRAALRKGAENSAKIRNDRKE